VAPTSAAGTGPDPQHAERMSLYASVRTELSAAREKSFELFDGAILTLSSGGLGVSMSVVKDVVPLAGAHFRWMLVTSWVCFAAAIVSTLVSFLMSQAAVDAQLRIAEDYYLRGNEAALERPNRWSAVTLYLNLGSALFFVAAVVLTVMFVALNLS
jgi:hypothetical protein